MAGTSVSSFALPGSNRSSPCAISVADPLSLYLVRKHEIDAAIARVLTSGRYILGDEVAAFETEFASYVGVRFAIGVGSGTEALHLALLSCEVGTGDEVITVSHTAGATVAAIELAGARPVLVDIDPVTFTIDPSQIEAKITRRTKAIVPVHLYGHPADMQPIVDIASRQGIVVVEDCAQSHGAVYQNRRAGAWGTAAAFSFYPTKNLGALGDAGMILTNDRVIGERARLLRQYGWRERYISEVAGLNTRLDELQAAILRAKLPYLEGENQRRRSLALMYDQLLAHTDLVVPKTREGALHVYHQYVVRTRQREDLQAYLGRQGIQTAVHYPVPVHLHPAYRFRLGGERHLPYTEQVCREILSLPMHPQLSESQITLISSAIAEWSGQSGRDR